MPIAPSIIQRLHLLDSRGAEDLSNDELMDRLATFNGRGEHWQLPTHMDIEERAVPGPHGEIPIRIYSPPNPSGTYVVWAHGGGFVSGTLDWPEAHVLSSELASRSGAVVVSVDYRLASSTTRYPVPKDDVVAATTWAESYAVSHSASPALVLAGASAGAALALSSAQDLPDIIDGVLLCYPFVHFPVPAPALDLCREMDALPQMLRFRPEGIEGMVRSYVGRIHNLPPDAMPGHAHITKDAPPTFILLSEFDDLRPSGELLARQFREAGRSVNVRVEPGVLHGHLNRHPGDPGVNESLDWLAGAIRSITPWPSAVLTR